MLPGKHPRNVPISMRKDVACAIGRTARGHDARERRDDYLRGQYRDSVVVAALLSAPVAPGGSPDAPRRTSIQPYETRSPARRDAQREPRSTL
eukprot:6030139-Prymnesium_polylepis.1